MILKIKRILSFFIKLDILILTNRQDECCDLTKGLLMFDF